VVQPALPVGRDARMPRSVTITECRYIPYRDQQRYLDDGWTLIPQSGPHAAYSVIAYREIPDWRSVHPLRNSNDGRQAWRSS
jgi:hypothetical protein